MADSLTDPVCLEDFESYARQYLPNHAFEFFAGGANEETTIRENVEAFKRCENIQNGGGRKGLRYCGIGSFLVRCCGNFYFKVRYCGFQSPSGLR